MASNSKLIHFTEEYEAHNYRHVIALLDGSKRVRNMMDDISHVQNKRVRIGYIKVQIRVQCINVNTLNNYSNLINNLTLFLCEIIENIS